MSASSHGAAGTRDGVRLSGSSRTARWLKTEWLLVVFGGLTIALAVSDPQPLTGYGRWLQLPTLAGLMGLLIAIQGICDSGLVQRAAGNLAVRMHTLRSLGLLLVAATALLSMVLTNDVSLFLIVPLTVAIGGISNLPILRMVVLEALAVNAGSTLSPIGNPQNLLLWQHAQVPFLRFVWAMLPTAAVMFALVAVLAWFWLPRRRIELSREKVGPEKVGPEKVSSAAIDIRLGALSLIALLAMVALMEYGLALAGALGLLALFAFAARASLQRIDWWLLLTFAAIFVGLGHLAELPQVSRALDHLDLHQPLTLYVSGIVASQLISNVPATVLLLHRSPDALALAVAVNVGGFGLAIGSLANLIALRLARQPHGLRQFHLVSIPFLLVCAPLVYFVGRWVAL